MLKRRVTLQDVAKQAGVSKVTVSNILNKRETAVPISETTRERVLAAVQELGYYPNAVARALARQRADAIAVVLQFPSIFQGWSGFTNELMHGVSDRAIELNFDILLHTRAQGSLEAEAQALMDGRVDGALLLRDYEDPLSDLLTDHGFPHVLFFTRSRRDDVYWVDCDNRAGARLAVEHLLNLGHQRIAHLAGPPSAYSACERRQGYMATLRDHGIEVKPEWIIPLHYPGADFTPLANLLQQRDHPTALFVWSDDVAMRALSVCAELGLSVPEEIAIVGFDSTQICEHTSPNLSSVNQPIYQMASDALAILASLVSGKPVEPRARLYTPSLDIRGSCGAKKGGNA